MGLLNFGIVQPQGIVEAAATPLVVQSAISWDATVVISLFTDLCFHLSLCNHGLILNLSLSLGRLASWNSHSSPLLKSFQNCLPVYTIIYLFD